MKNFFLGVGLLVALCGCTDKPATTSKPATGDVVTGKAIAEKECKTCHGLDGKGVAPAIPNLAAQREAYLVAALKEYKAVLTVSPNRRNSVAGLKASTATEVSRASSQR